jgi:hypothetical protein
MNKFTRLSLLALMLSGLAACSGGEAYIYSPYSINRELETYPDGPEITEGSVVTVCYAKSKSMPQTIRQLAAAECSKGNLGIVFVEQTYNVCPMMTPNAAVFSCENVVAGHSAQPGSASAVKSILPQPAFAAPKPAGAGRTFGNIGAADVSTTAKSQPFPTYLFNNGQSGN